MDGGRHLWTTLCYDSRCSNYLYPMQSTELGIIESLYTYAPHCPLILQVGGALQSPVPGANLPYSYPFGFQQQPAGAASGASGNTAPGMWPNPSAQHGAAHMPSFPLHPELQQFEYSPVTRFSMSDQMSYSTDPYLMDSAEWGLKQSHRLDKPKVPAQQRYKFNGAKMIQIVLRLTKFHCHGVCTGNGTFTGLDTQESVILICQLCYCCRLWTVFRATR